jgi:hypothetical protein
MTILTFLENTSFAALIKPSYLSVQTAFTFRRSRFGILFKKAFTVPFSLPFNIPNIGSAELTEWVEAQKEALYKGCVGEVIDEIKRRLAMLSNIQEHCQERLEKIKNYLEKRKDKMNYKSLRDQDLEILSGVVEGAVRYVISQRFDNGGMRWIKERAEALLQLRCIELNGTWDRFVSFVHERMKQQVEESKKTSPLTCSELTPLPIYGCC